MLKEPNLGSVKNFRRNLYKVSKFRIFAITFFVDTHCHRGLVEGGESQHHEYVGNSQP